MSTIKLELSNEDRRILEGLTGSITLLASVLGSMQPPEVQQKIIQEVTPEHPVDTPTTHLEPPAAEPAPEVTLVSFPEFQKAVTIACAKGPKQKAAAREIINKYAASVSAVPEDKRAEIMAELANL